MPDTRKLESSSTWSAKPVPASPGFYIPGNFAITATVHDPIHGPIEVGIDVEVHDGRATARRVSIGTERDGGVNAKMIRAVKIRDIVATEALKRLLSVETQVDADGNANARFWPVRDSEAVRQAVRTLVGYVEVKP